MKRKEVKELDFSENEESDYDVDDIFEDLSALQE